MLFAYCEVSQSTTGYSLFELLYGQEMRRLLDVLREERETSQKSHESVLSHILLVRKRLEEMSELVNENLKVAQKCQNKWNKQVLRKTTIWVLYLASRSTEDN